MHWAPARCLSQASMSSSVFALQCCLRRDACSLIARLSIACAFVQARVSFSHEYVGTPEEQAITVKLVMHLVAVGAGNRTDNETPPDIDHSKVISTPSLLNKRPAADALGGGKRAATATSSILSFFGK